MQRTGTLLLLGLVWGLVAGSCVPLLDLETGGPGADRPRTRSELSVDVLRPGSDRTVAKGTRIEIEWTAGNLTGAEAIATVLLRNREDLSERIISGGIRVLTTGQTQTLVWDTGQFEGGSYSVVVRVEAGGRTAEGISPGRITVNTPPSLEFTEPSGDVTFGLPEDAAEGEEPEPITVRWTAFDPDGDGVVALGLDPDGDHDSGNEVTILERDILLAGGVDSFSWDGSDTDGDAVEAGRYRLFARLSDDINEDVFVNAGVHVTVLESAVKETFDASKISVTSPEEDVEFLTDGDPLTIEYAVSKGQELLVDISLDTDDSPSNGNEQVILSQRFLDGDVDTDSFEWDGTDAQGDPVPDGIYKIVLVVNTGEGSPVLKSSDALVLRRSFEDQPLVGVLTPDRDTQTNAGAFVLIRWRDDDPTGEAVIRIVVDDDATPDEDVETDEAEIEVLRDRAADPDGVQDSFQYSVSSTLAPGQYWFHVYIDRDGEPPYDHVSTAARPMIIRDPERE